MRYRGIQLDYVRMQLDTVGYIGIQWICRKMAQDIDRYRDTRDTKDTLRYRWDAGGIQAGYPPKYTPGEG